MMHFTISPIETMPTTFLCSRTGKWRTVLSVMTAMHSSTVWSRRAQITLVDMISRTVVDGDVQPRTVQEMEKGVWIADARTGTGTKTGRSHINVIRRSREKSVLEITLREGRNPQVRRTLAKLGHKVRDLMRVKMGPLTLHGLAVGHVRTLTPREVKELRRLPRRAHAGAAGESSSRDEGREPGRRPRVKRS